MRREGRGHKLGAEETGVNRIFKGGHSPTPSASAPPSSLTAATAPPPPKQSQARDSRRTSKEKLQMLGRSRRRLLISRGDPWRQGEESLGAPEAPCSGCPVSGEQHDNGGLFPSMLCLSGLNTTSGLLPPPLLLFSSNRAARIDPASRAALTSQTLPSAWPHAHHPRQDRVGLGGVCLCLKPGQPGVHCAGWRTVTKATPDSQGTTQHPPEALPSPLVQIQGCLPNR